MINKKKLTKQVWWENELWDVVEVFSPTEGDDYILVKKVVKDEDHWAGGTEDSIYPIQMCLIDAHNQNFYPNTKEVRNAMAKVINIEQQQSVIWSEVGDILNGTWLDIVMEE